MKELEWYCVEWGFNEKRPRLINVMRAINIDDLKKKLKYKGKKPTKYNSIKNYEELREYLKSQFMCRFWCRCEYEMIVTSWPPRNDIDGTKIDVFDQIAPNIDRITEYVVQVLKLDFKSNGTVLEDTLMLRKF